MKRGMSSGYGASSTCLRGLSRGLSLTAAFTPPVASLSFLCLLWNVWLPTADVPNPMFFMPGTKMLFGDARETCEGTCAPRPLAPRRSVRLGVHSSGPSLQRSRRGSRRESRPRELSRGCAPTRLPHRIFPSPLLLLDLSEAYQGPFGGCTLILHLQVGISDISRKELCYVCTITAPRHLLRTLSAARPQCCSSVTLQCSCPGRRGVSRC